MMKISSRCRCGCGSAPLALQQLAVTWRTPNRAAPRTAAAAPVGLVVVLVVVAAVQRCSTVYATGFPLACCTASAATWTWLYCKCACRPFRQVNP
jgi:hypothetical protein